ncbi:MAG: ABC transporter permease [Spirochaetae bacterium HGW-Spirochaetae-7]|jgi:phospholipid/cholesterol/gamma-HCH transport system permease protein|nr:MAG: ABC transporter permease [Spirochaetae bacterium HGW-Spirochaetae-7]
MITALGRSAKLKASSLLYGMGFFYNVLKETARFFRRSQVGYKVLIMQILFTGYEALAINAVMAIAIGAAINVIGSSLLPQFGQSQLMYTILIIVITRELGPLLTAFVITARSGTAIATELGTMVVNHEIEAYLSVGLNPISYLVVPRFIGVVVSMLVLTVYFNIFGLLGSFIVVQVIKPTPILEYLTSLLSALSVGDVVSGLVKALVFGIVVSVVSTYQGFSVNRASTEIPVAGIRAVGLSFILIIVADIIVTLMQYA